MDGCTAINFVKHVKIGFVQVGLFVLHDGICGSFHNKATINASANLDEDSFDMLYKNYCWAAIPDPWMTNVSYERKIDMLSSTDNNFLICLFDFERFSTESRFPFLNSRCIMIWSELPCDRVRNEQYFFFFFFWGGGGGSQWPIWLRCCNRLYYDNRSSKSQVK